MFDRRQVATHGDNETPSLERACPAKMRTGAMVGRITAIVLLLFVGGGSSSPSVVSALSFASITGNIYHGHKKIVLLNNPNRILSRRRPASSSLSASNNNAGGGEESLLKRFTDPIIDDPGLPLTDALLAQIVAPTFEVYWLLLNKAPSPSWLAPIGRYFGETPELAPRGSLLAPALIHGAGLAVCWGAGALAARMYEKEAYTLNSNKGSNNNNIIGEYASILGKLVQAGAFSIGILIISTQIDLLLEFHGRFVQLGESDETDFRLLVAIVEVINDIFWEALVLCTWRIVHSNFMSDADNRFKRF